MVIHRRCLCGKRRFVEPVFSFSIHLDDKFNQYFTNQMPPGALV
jgi:hypothetical protein